MESLRTDQQKTFMRGSHEHAVFNVTGKAVTQGGRWTPVPGQPGFIV